MISFTTLATTALGFTIALAWNEAVSKTIRSLYPPSDDKDVAHAMFVYALVITLMVIIIVAAINSTLKIIYIANGKHEDTEDGSGPVVTLWEPGEGAEYVYARPSRHFHV